MILELDSVTKKYKIPIKSKNILKDIFVGEYKDFVAVDNISLKVEKGETIGYIGLNGAGKSTTIKLMTGILTPTEGNVNLFGEPIQINKKEKNKRFSAVFGQRSNLWYDLPVIDSYKYIAVLYGVSKERFQINLKHICKMLDIGDLLDRPVRKLSLGQKMKCELGGALIFDPEILFLDEPTIGLDIFAKENFLQCVKHIREKSDTTVFFTSHNMEEIEQLCDRIIVLDKGKILFDGNLEKIKNIVGDYHKVKLYIDDYDENCEDKYRSYQVTSGDNGVIELNINKQKINIADVINYYFRNFNVKDINIENNGLEQLIKHLYNKEFRNE